MSLVIRFYNLVRARAGGACLCVFLLLIRVVWGWQFFEAGRGKLLHIDKPIRFFHELHIPLPTFNAWFVSIVEALGGLMLLAGLGSRAIALVLLIDMVVAYTTADFASVAALFKDGDVPKFAAAAPFWFLVTSFLILALGPGLISLDSALQRIVFARDKSKI